MPYFILIFANVKIKDKSEYSRDLTNRKKKSTNRVDRYCLEIFIVELLRSTFDSASLFFLYFLMPSCFWIWHFSKGMEDTIERAVRDQH